MQRQPLLIISTTLTLLQGTISCLLPGWLQWTLNWSLCFLLLPNPLQSIFHPISRMFHFPTKALQWLLLACRNKSLLFGWPWSFHISLLIIHISAQVMPPQGTFPYHHSNNVPSQSLFIQSIAVFSSHLLSLSVSSKSLALNYLFPLICKFYESGTWCVVFPALPEYIAECWAHWKPSIKVYWVHLPEPGNPAWYSPYCMSL